MVLVMSATHVPLPSAGYFGRWHSALQAAGFSYAI
jgi:hypothetical protein